MPRPSVAPLSLNLPPQLDPDVLPRLPTRRQMIEIHRFYFGPISASSIEHWPLPWRVVNGKSVAPLEAFLAEAQRRLDEAPATTPRWAESSPASSATFSADREAVHSITE